MRRYFLWHIHTIIHILWYRGKKGFVDFVLPVDGHMQSKVRAFVQRQNYQFEVVGNKRKLSDSMYYVST